MLPHSSDIGMKGVVSTNSIKRVDIFRSYSDTQRQMILISGAMVAMLTPFCDTVYLPALDNVTTELRTTEVLTSITVSAYLGAVGIGQLLWGPLSDFYGRVPVLFGSLLIFEAFTIGCIFAQNIISLIVLRTIEGFLVGCCIVSVQAVISDVFAPEVRGAALSYFLGPMLIGPIIAPLVGGILAEKYSWRADFVLLALMTLPITLFTYIYTPETHHWYVVRSRSAQLLKQIEEQEQFNLQGIPITNRNTAGNTDVSTSDKLSTADVELGLESVSGAVDFIPNTSVCASDKSCLGLDGSTHNSRGSSDNAAEQNGQDNSLRVNRESDSHSDKMIDLISDISPPEMMMPWTVAALLFDLELSAYYAAVGFSFACMFTSLTLLPIYLAQAPYDLNPGIVGVTFLPVGVAMLVGALVGGRISDWSKVYYPQSPHSINFITLLLSCVCPLGTVGFGFSLQGGKPLYAVLITQCILGFGQAVIMPSTLSFLSCVRPDSAGAAGSTMLFVCFVLAAISISVSTIVSDLIGVGYYFLAVAALSSVANVCGLWICIYRIFYSPPTETAAI